MQEKHSQVLVVLLNYSALQCDLLTVNEYFLLRYFSRDSPPKDLKRRELTFQSPACRETEKKGRETETQRKEGMKTKEREGEWEQERRIDKVRDVDRNDENVGPDMLSTTGRKQDERERQCQ